MLKNWRAVLVLPQTRRVLESQLRKLAPGADGFFILFCLLTFGYWCGCGVAPGGRAQALPWRGTILLLNHNRGN